MFYRWGLAALFIMAVAADVGWSASGTEGASFLDIPVGAAPAALGSAYTAQATDIYAPIWNPAGLGSLHSIEVGGMHLSYLDPFSYEHVGFVIPMGKEGENGTKPAGIGASMQYLGSKSIDGRDNNGNPTGSFSTSFAAYTLAYGQRIQDRLSVGMSVKMIQEKISDASASAYAADAGLLYKASDRLSLGAVLANMGTKIKFVNEADSLPFAGRFGGTYHLRPDVDLSLEGVYRQTGLASASLGLEWWYGDLFALRGGYNTSHTKELGAASGFTAGMGLTIVGLEFAYAWVPFGDLGQTHYLSLIFRAGSGSHPEQSHMKKSASAQDDFDDMKLDNPKHSDNLYELLNAEDEKDFR